MFQVRLRFCIEPHSGYPGSRVTSRHQVEHLYMIICIRLMTTPRDHSPYDIYEEKTAFPNMQTNGHAGHPSSRDKARDLGPGRWLQATGLKPGALFLRQLTGRLPPN